MCSHIQPAELRLTELPSSLIQAFNLQLATQFQVEFHEYSVTLYAQNEKFQDLMFKPFKL